MLSAPACVSKFHCPDRLLGIDYPASSLVHMWDSAPFVAFCLDRF